MEPTVDISELYAAHRLALVRLAILLVDDLASAEDVVQDPFAALARRPDAVKDPSKTLAYLRVSVVKTSRSALRRRRTTRDHRARHEADEAPYVTPIAEETIGVGGSARFADGYRFDVRIEAGRLPVLVVSGDDGRTIRHELAIDDPGVVTVQPTSVFSDGASLLVTSVSDPSYVEVLVQDGEAMRALAPVGGDPPEERGGRAVVAHTERRARHRRHPVISDGDGTWQAWQWTMVSRTEMAALPTGTVQSDLLNAIRSTPGSGDQSRSGSRA